MAASKDKPAHVRSNRRSHPRISASEPALATVLVGEEKKRFVVHESVLTHYSDFFRAALTGNFREAEEKVVTLVEEKPDIFEFFVHWLYYQRLPDEQMHDDKDIVDMFYDEGVPDHETVIKLYVFGNKYDVPDLRKDTIDLFFHLIVHSEGPLANAEAVAYAFDQLSKTDPMCRLLVDLQCHYEVEDIDRTDYDNIVFIKAVWQRYVEICWTRDTFFDDDLKLCDYHEHATDNERTACAKE